MALQESLNKFRQQQWKFQHTSTSIASTKSSSVPPKAPTPVKFSHDTERLQHMNSIRKSPVGAQIKRVIDLLRETRKAYTPDPINGACYVDVSRNKAVFDSLRNNPKLRYDGKYFTYNSKYNLKDKAALLDLIQKEFPDGVQVNDLKDTYPTVTEDLQALKAAGEIYLLSSDSKEHIAYAIDTRLSLKVDDDLKQLFHEIELPRDMIDMERDLHKNGMKAAIAKRRAIPLQVHNAAPQTKAGKQPRGISKRAKLTNAHLPELFSYLYGPST